MKELKNITFDNFKKYGTVIEFPKDFKDEFLIVDTEDKEPWRIAVFRYTNKTIKKIECHPTSKESFEPLRGVTVLLVAEHDAPENYEVFILDKPVCLGKGIWHQVLSITDEAQVKITENLEVESVFYELEKEISVQVAPMK